MTLFTPSLRLHSHLAFQKSETVPSLTSSSHISLSVSPQTLRSHSLFLAAAHSPAHPISFLQDMLVSQFHRNAKVLLAQSAAVAVFHFIRGRRSKRGSRYGSVSQSRRRRTVSDVYSCLGDLYFKRAYRMSYRSFWKLHAQLKEGIEKVHKQLLEKMKKQRRALLRARGSGSIRRRLNNPITI